VALVLELWSAALGGHWSYDRRRRRAALFFIGGGGVALWSAASDRMRARALKQRTRWTVVFLVLQWSATSLI